MTASTRARPRPNASNAEASAATSATTATTTKEQAIASSNNDPAAPPRRALQTRRLSQGGVSTAAASPGAGTGAAAVKEGPVMMGISSTGIPQSGTVNIDIAIVHSLPDGLFPLPGYPLRPLDAADPLLILCGKAIASCSNRALTPKELALICSTKYGWTCEGSQPFAVVSAAIRSHLRRAATANPPYPPIFSTYELSSVIPTQDIPCIGIEPEARPVVKRGTFWFLAETVGFSSPFPHRPSTSMLPQALGTGTKQKASTITLSFLSQTKPKNEEKPLTRAQANASSSSTSSSSASTNVVPEIMMQQQQDIAPQQQQQQQPVPMLALDSDPLGRGKRKRTLSSNTIMATSSPAHLQPIAPLPPVLEHASTTSFAASSVPASSSADSSNSRRTRQAHRRAFSSGSQDGQRPSSSSNLKKLKFRLSTLSEVDANGNVTPATQKRPLQPQHHSSASLITSSSTSKSTRSSAQQQPNSKRQRTQSMSVLSSAVHPFTASFPFDNLHLHHSMQIPSHNGTLMPIEMHNILSSSSFPSSAHLTTHQLDLLTSRSAPESNIFSPSTASAMYIGGPFSRRTSPSASNNGHHDGSSSAYRSHPTEDGFDLDDSVVGTPADNDYFDTFDNSVTSTAGAGWMASNNTSFTSLGDLSLLSNEEHDGDLQDFHSEMLKNDLDLAFDFSLDSLEREREFSDNLENEDVEQQQHDAGHSIVGAEALDLSSLSDDVNGIFDGIGAGSTAEVVAAGDAIMDVDNAESTAQAGAVRAASTFSSQSTEVDEREEDDDEDAESSAETIMQDGNEILLKKALNTTLCPAAAAARYGDAMRPGRLLARRMNSASSLIFPRAEARPATLSRNNSRDVLTTPVPLAELPGLSDHVPPHPIFFYSEEDEAFNKENSTHLEDDRTAASSPLTPIIKAEEDGDDFVPAAGSANEEHASSAHQSRATSHVSQDSSDSFNAESMYTTRASSGTGGAGGAEDFEEPESIIIGGVPASRSQSSSRVSSLSPRDSFSPQATGLGPPAEWALTPPSEEEHTEEEEKLLDRATLLGPESVGMDDLDDAWPGSRDAEDAFSNEASATTGSSSFVEHAATFEPVLSPDPIPAALTPFMLPSGLPQLEQNKEKDIVADAAMEVDQQQDEPATEVATMYAVEDVRQAKGAVESSEALSTGLPASEGLPSTTQASDSAMQVFSEAAEAEAAIAQDAPANPQSFLFYPDTPFKPDMAILLTETKILFYSTMVTIGEAARPLLRRVDNDAVDGEALLLSLEGATDLDEQRRETFDTIKKLGNTWVSLDYARELLAKFGGENPSLETFLADDILLSWNEKLVRLGTMLRQRNDLATPVKKPTTAEHRKKVAAVVRANKKAVSAAAAAKKSASPSIGAVTPIAIAPNPNKSVDPPKQEAPSTPVAPASNTNKKGRAPPATTAAATPARRSTRNRGNPNSA